MDAQPPDWARQLAAEAIRQREERRAAEAADALEATWCSTPRWEDDDVNFLFWLRAAERFAEAAAKSWIEEGDWVFWCAFFRALPPIAPHFDRMMADLHAKRALTRPVRPARHSAACRRHRRRSSAAARAGQPPACMCGATPGTAFAGRCRTRGS